MGSHFAHDSLTAHFGLTYASIPIALSIYGTVYRTDERIGEFWASVTRTPIFVQFLSCLHVFSFHGG